MLAREMWDVPVSGFLNDNDFLRVVLCTPLICIDLIIRDESRKLLVGLRCNEPGKGKYFVPGGRIRKDERIEDAFKRILTIETGLHVPFAATRFLGTFEHFHETNVCNALGFGTHCVVLAYEISIVDGYVRPDAQHESFKWLSEDELIAASDVHELTKAYVGPAVPR